VASLADLLARAAADLTAAGARFAVVGGLAVSARTEPRFTRDVDLAVAVADDLEAEALVQDLRGRGHRLVALVEQEDVGRLATVRLESDTGNGSMLDLLFAASGIEREVVAGATTMELLPGVRLPVASVGHLLALKVLACDDRRRPQDRSDLAALLAVATGPDIESARQALDLIRQRGFHRGRDLSGLFGSLRTGLAPGE
jgi:predicted nucleotidyltransferase